MVVIMLKVRILFSSFCEMECYTSLNGVVQSNFKNSIFLFLKKLSSLKGYFGPKQM